MPFWQKAVLGLAMVVGVAGAGAQLATRSAPPPPAPTANESTSAAPEGSRGFVSGQPQATPAQQPPAPEETWVQKASPVATKSGIGFVGAFLVGWLFRVFLKTMAVITAIGVAILLALSYFNVIDIDVSAAKQQWSSISGFLTTQAGNLKELLMNHLPASSASAGGFVVGLCRK
jgi:uncharacterized membrane protein (Fun14 family)